MTYNFSIKLKHLLKKKTNSEEKSFEKYCNFKANNSFELTLHRMFYNVRGKKSKINLLIMLISH